MACQCVHVYLTFQWLLSLYFCISLVTPNYIMHIKANGMIIAMGKVQIEMTGQSDCFKN